MLIHVQLRRLSAAQAQAKTCYIKDLGLIIFDNNLRTIEAENP